MPQGTPTAGSPQAGTNAAVNSLAGAITNPEAHQAPPATEEGAGSAVPDPTPAPANANPNAAPPATPPAPAAPAPATPPAPANAITPEQILAQLTLPQLSEALKSLAGDEGVSAEDAMSANINERLAKARQQEKDKLYGQIEQQKTDIAAAQKVINDQAEALKTQAAQPPASEEGTKPPANSELPEGAVTADQFNQALEKGLEKVTDAYEGKITELSAQLQSMKDSAHTSDLDAHRNALIEAYRGKIVEELVQGNTKEDLDNSIVLAQQVYAKTVAQVTTGEQAAAAAAPTVPPNPTVTPPAQGAPAGQPANGQPAIPASLSDFGANRADILARANAAARAEIAGLGPA